MRLTLFLLRYRNQLSTRSDRSQRRCRRRRARTGPGTDRRYWQPRLALRTATYEYVEYTDASRTSVSFREYYDLLGDPFELDNVLADDITSNDPDIAALHAALKRSASCVGSGCPGRKADGT
jgi:hypothetical protein